jgi:hypothetical protein
MLAVRDHRHHLVGVTFLDQLASDDVLDAAYDWLCRRRWEYSANSDVWAFRRHWPHEKERIKNELHAVSFRFSLLSRITPKDGEDTNERGRMKLHPFQIYTPAIKNETNPLIGAMRGSW